MWFGVLGPLEVRLDGSGEPLAVGGPRVRALLAMLLLEPGRVVPHERLIDGLYGEEPPAGAANALQSQVSRLRRGLGEAGDLVEFHAAGYRLAVDPEAVDVHRFQRLAGAGRRALAAGRHTEAAAALGEALGLWRGPALVGFADVPFAETQVARLEELRTAAVEDRAEAQLALGEHQDMIGELRTLVTAHPLRERARGLLMRALYAGGRQAEALEVYEDARRTLAEELGTDPSPELASVHLAILRADPALGPAPVAAPALPRLPAPLTSFVGREEELGAVGRMLAGGRLVTLIGPGGAGKTRLAVEAGARWRGEACFLDLASLGDGSEVPGALLTALGIREGGLRPGAAEPGADQVDPVDRLVTALTGRPMLLILDNCEHVVEAAARIAHRLLGACPELRVLATSREPLSITGETLHPLPMLGLPPYGTRPVEALGYPAVRLFADRAAAVRPGFAVDADTAELVIRICTALDGLPLAIELAAARLRALPLGEVVARLDDRFRLLSRGDRAAAPRHQTLRAVVEWSWDMLGSAEQALARRLSVFAGSFDLAAAEGVCGVDEPAGELLADLVDKSLVQSDGERYRMLDTLRAFCAERLEEAGETADLRRAHARYFLDLALTADSHLRGADQLEWLARLAADHGNLHGALRWAVAADRELALRLIAALSWYWWLRGRVEGAELAAAVLRDLAEVPDGLDEEYVLSVLNALPGGDLDGAHIERATETLRNIRRLLRRPVITVLWALFAGPYRTDLASFALQIGPDPWSQALRHMGNAFQLQFAGQQEEAEPEFRTALAGFREAGDRWGMANSLDPLAQLAEWRGDWAGFASLLDEALELVTQLGALEDTADLLCRRADGLIRAGDYEAAYADLKRAMDLARRAGAPDKVASVRYGMGEVARRRGDLAEARRHYEAALDELPRDWFVAGWTRAYVQIGLGWVAIAESDVPTARSRHREGLATALRQGNNMIVALGVEGMAGTALLDGDGERAAALLGLAAALRGTAMASNPDVAEVAAGARELIGEAAYDAAYERGATMSAEDALA